MAFEEHSCTIDKDQKAKSCFDIHKINELLLIGVKNPTFYTFLGDTQP